MTSKTRFLLATGFGSGLMYFLDPQGGRRRRAVARDVIVRANDVAGKTARHLRNLTRGLFGSDPKTLMDEDLVRMKTYLETGRVRGI